MTITPHADKLDFVGTKGRSERLPWTPLCTCTALATTPGSRAEAYRQPLREVPSDDDLAAIQARLQQQRAPGLGAFRAMVEARTR